MIARTATPPPILRCPACGQGVNSPDAPRCPLCNFDFGDHRVTGADVSPYAKSYAQGEGGWLEMCRWVWSAGSERLKHIALMRTSAAARRFTWINLLWLALTIAGFQAAHVGWREVLVSRASKPDGSTKPMGRGWMHVAGAPLPLSPNQSQQVPIDLWWNSAQSMIASAAAGLAALLLMWLLILSIKSGLRFAHSAPYRREERMSAALLYSTAWWVPAMVGIVICYLRPLASFGRVSHWAWYPTGRGLSLIAGAIVGLAVTLWWFWLIRLGASAPAVTRGRVMAFCVLGIPLLLAGATAAWRFGLDAFHEFLFLHLNMHF